MSSASLILARRTQEEIDAQLARMLSLEPVQNSGSVTASGALTSAAPISSPFDVDLQSKSKTKRKNPKNAKRPSDSASSKASTSSAQVSSKSRSVSLPSRAIAFALIDPNPDIHSLFLQFNDQFFDGLLAGVEVKWSTRMKLCAGVCSYEGRGGLCSVRLSEPLLKFRPTSDMIDTLLHEMIHAFLFVTENNRDRSGHGPQFCAHMRRINNTAGTKITVYHSFHDEVDVHRNHWWKCDGACVKKPPFFGIVKRSMNRAPGPNDTWHANHLRTCGGTFRKIKEPEGFTSKKRKKPDKSKAQPVNNTAKSKKPKSIRKPSKNPATASKTTENARKGQGSGKGGHILQPLGANSNAAVSSRIGGAKRPRNPVVGEQDGSSKLKSMLIESAKRRKVGVEKREENSRSGRPCTKSSSSSRSGTSPQISEKAGLKSESSSGSKNLPEQLPPEQSDTDTGSSSKSSLLSSWLKRRNAVLGKINYTPMEFTPGKPHRPKISSISKTPSTSRSASPGSSSSSAPFPRTPLSTASKSTSKQQSTSSKHTQHPHSNSSFPTTSPQSYSTSASVLASFRPHEAFHSISSAPYPRSPSRSKLSKPEAHSGTSSSGNILCSSLSQNTSGKSPKSAQPSIVDAFRDQSPQSEQSMSQRKVNLGNYGNRARFSSRHESDSSHSQATSTVRSKRNDLRNATDSRGTLPSKNATQAQSPAHSILDLTNSDSDNDTSDALDRSPVRHDARKNSSSTTQVVAKSHARCPVCQASIPHWFINSHLDQCARVGKNRS